MTAIYCVRVLEKSSGEFQFVDCFAAKAEAVEWVGNIDSSPSWISGGIVTYHPASATYAGWIVAAVIAAAFLGTFLLIRMSRGHT